MNTIEKKLEKLLQEKGYIWHKKNDTSTPLKSQYFLIKKNGDKIQGTADVIFPIVENNE